MFLNDSIKVDGVLGKYRINLSEATQNKNEPTKAGIELTHPIK